MGAEARGAARLGAAASRVAALLMPSPFALAVLLTVVVLFAALLGGREVVALPWGERLAKVVGEGWFGGLSSPAGLAFALQMVLVLVTGHALALSPPVRRAIDAVAVLPRTAPQATALVALVACVAGYVHWGLGAVAGAMLARELGRSWQARGKALHYPLAGAAAYSGLLVWHGGLSGSAPLTVAGEGHFLAASIGVIPVGRTLFAAPNLLITGGLIALTVVFYAWLTPAAPDAAAARVPPEEAPEDAEETPGGASEASGLLPRLLDDGLVVPGVVGVLAFGYLGWAFWEKGFAALTLDTLNLGFLALGLGLHGSPRRWLAAAAEGAKGAAGIVVQFPLYFGILGVLKGSGLVAQLSELFIALATPATLPLWTFLSAGLVNLVVPSGGGQWAIQGPIMSAAAQRLNVPVESVVMALAYGDAWTNMLQPFWALPLLGIMRLRARDIAGYTALLCALAGIFIALMLLIL